MSGAGHAAREDKNMNPFADAIESYHKILTNIQTTTASMCELGFIESHEYADIQTQANKLDVQLQQLIDPIPESAVKPVFTSPLKAKRDTPVHQPARIARSVSPVREHVMPRRLDFSNRRKNGRVGSHVRVTFVRKDLPAYVTPTAADLQSYTGVVLDVKKTKTATHKIKYSDRSVRWEYMPYLKRYNLVTFL